MRPLTGLAFPESVGYVNLDAGDYNIKVTQTTTTDPAVINADVTLDNGSAYTVIALNDIRQY